MTLSSLDWLMEGAEFSAPELPPFPWRWGGASGFCGANSGSAAEYDLSQGLEKLGWQIAEGEEWFAHAASGWLFNSKEKVFFHQPSNRLVSLSDAATSALADGGKSGVLKVGDIAACREKSDVAEWQAVSSDFDETEKEETEEVEAASDSDVELDLERDLHAGTAQKKRRREAEESRPPREKRNRQRGRLQLLAQLNQSSDLSSTSLRPEECHMTAAVEAIVRSFFNAFALTDKNYLELTRRTLTQDAGSTACVALFFGPDESGLLQLVTANAGDSRAVLCRDGTALRLTEDHRPSDPSEKRRIKQAGGNVVAIAGVPRVTLPDFSTSRRTIALSTSRGLGDSVLKEPKAVVSSLPTVRVCTLDFEKDAFLVLGTDGVFDVLSDEEVVAMILKTRPPSPEDAAKLIVDEATRRKGHDDKTCTVVYFRWRTDLFPRESTPPAPETENSHLDTEEPSAVSDVSLISNCTASAPEGADAKVVETSSSSRGRDEEDGKHAEEDLQTPLTETRESDAADSASAPASVESSLGAEADSQSAKQQPEQSISFLNDRGLDEIASRQSAESVESIIRKRRRQELEEMRNNNAVEDEEDVDLFSCE